MSDNTTDHNVTTYIVTDSGPASQKFAYYFIYGTTFFGILWGLFNVYLVSYLSCSWFLGISSGYGGLKPSEKGGRRRPRRKAFAWQQEARNNQRRS